LVVAFTRCAVANEPSAFGFGDFDLAFGDDGARNGCAEQVTAFVNGLGFEGGVDVVADELFFEVFDIDFGRADFKRFGFGSGEVFFLADIGDVGDDFLALFDEPFQDDGGVQSAGICQYDFAFWCCAHVSSSLCFLIAG
jgi:hypothetical protein